MIEGDPTITTPTSGATPPRSGGLSAGRLILLGLIAFAVATFVGRLDLSGLVSDARGAIDRAVTAVQTGAPVASAGSATVAAIKDVVERANAAQAAALSQNDPTPMRATATDSYYQELVQTNRDLASSGAQSIQLVSLEWGDVTVDGTVGHATTIETWRTRYSDGSTDERTDRNEYTLVQQGGRWRISADVQPASRVISPGTGTVPSVTQPANTAAVTSTSSNWSGYAASGGVFTSVTGTWTVPTVSSTSVGADATWVGIGGLTSRDLIQAGTQAMVDGTGSVTYEAWIETLPQPSRTVSLSVKAGDSVTVTITQQSGDDWLITMKNNTTSSSYSVTVQYSSSRSSAEWIQEAPSVGRGLVPLDRFGTLQFSRASAVRDGKTLSLSALGAKAITMINDQGQAIAQPSTIAADGTSFTLTRTDASSSPSGRRRRP